MTKKVTISVSDELHEKMQDWKDSFNFSRIFQHAISKAIQKKENYKKRLKEDPEMRDIIERLKDEKLNLEKQWFETGKEDGFEFAKRTDYETLLISVGIEPFKETIRRENVIQFDPTTSEVLGDYFSDIFDDYELQGMGFEKTTFGNYIPNEIYREWESGWIQGVNEFWSEIKDKL